mgnify:CR=1 FL=1
MAITVNQIAEQCGVSRTTVLRALNGGSVSKETKEKTYVLHNKRVEDSALKVQALKVQRYVKLA